MSHLNSQIIKKIKEQTTSFDEQRKERLAIEYLTSLQEVKEWLENFLERKLPGTTTQLGKVLQNGVVLAAVAKKIAPDCVGKIFQGKTLSFLHTDNLNFFFKAINKEKLMPIGVIFETVDLYELKNMAGVLLTIYYLAIELHSRGLAQAIGDVAEENLIFSEQEKKKAMELLKDIDEDKMNEIKALKKKKSPQQVWTEWYSESLDLVSVIQGLCKSYYLIQKLEHEKEDFQKTNECIILLQSLFRKHQQKKQFNSQFGWISGKSDQLIVIQKHLRKYWDKKNLDETKKHYQNGESQLIKLQSILRKLKEKKKLTEKKTHYNSNEESIIKLQSLLRSRKNKNKLGETKKHYQTNEQPIVNLQSLFRKHLEKKKLDEKKNHYNTNEEGIIKLQALFRSRKQKKQLDETKKHYQTNEQPIVNLQSIFRRNLKKKKLQETKKHYNTNEESIIKLQALFRSRKQKKQLDETKKHYQTNEQPIVNLQSIFRRNLKKKKLQETKKHYNTNEEGIIKLQSFFRSRKIKNQLKETNSYNQENEGSIIKLQSLLRQKQQRKSHLSLTNYYKKNETGVTGLQALLRAYKLRKDFEFRSLNLGKTSTNLVRVQALVRRLLSQKLFEKKVDEAINIQRIYRGYFTKNIFSFMKKQSKKDINIKDLGKIFQLFGDQEMNYDNFNDPKFRSSKKKELENTNINELRKKWVIEVRETQVLNEQVSGIDKKIELLIKNAISIDEIDKSRSRRMRRRRKKNQEDETQPALGIKVLEHYQYLFYLLQTQPKYLARALYLIKPEDLEEFAQTMTLTLFGYAFSPREEYLLLKLFSLAIKEQVKRQKKPGEFISEDPAIAKMFVFYFRRFQYQSFLKELLEPVLESVIKETKILELNTTKLYKVMINEEETRTGKTSELPKNVTHEEALKQEYVQGIYDESFEKMSKFCTMFVDQLIDLIDKIPFGLRYSCKELARELTNKFQDMDKNTLIKVLANIVFFRYISSAIIEPERFGVFSEKGRITMNGVMNLGLLSKLLQSISNRKLFKENEPFMLRFNPLIKKLNKKLANFFLEMIKTQNLEDELEIDPNTELSTHKNPEIYISPNEIISTHKVLNKFLENIAEEKDDPLREILEDLNQFVIPDVDDDQEIQLVLQNKYQQENIQGADTIRKYNYVKDLFKTLLQIIPVSHLQQNVSLPWLIWEKEDYPEKVIGEIINPLMKNLPELEEKSYINREDGYLKIQKDIVYEMKNASRIYRRNKRELEQLQKNLDIVMKSKTYLTEQMEQFEEYLTSVRKNQFGTSSQSKKKKKKKKKRKKGQENFIVPPTTLKYKKLFKMKVILSSKIPKKVQKLTSFEFSSEKTGVFQVKAKLGGRSLQTLDLELEQLLAMQSSGESELQHDQITLHINFLIRYLNELMLKH
ncbi:patterned expression site [Anaeramoeba flamelloides]|uniref:Patterned expression site n=1 Tax=Anaeramoeba flamelloides TaxID=1746091 RepID=A0AAV7Z7Y8_9EUKA|nr:patterned expression site [Anaeramoeba flamelloides]